MPSSSRLLPGAPIHPDASCSPRQREIAPGEHQGPSRSGSTRRSESSSSKHRESSSKHGESSSKHGESSSKHRESSSKHRESSSKHRESSSKHRESSHSDSTVRPDNKFGGHRGTVTRVGGPNNQLAIIPENPEHITSLPVFAKDKEDKEDRTRTRSSRHRGEDRSETRSSKRHGDDRTETRSVQANSRNQLAVIKENDDRTKTRSKDDVTISHYADRSSSHYDDRSSSRYDDRSSSRYDDRSSSRYDDRSSSRYDDRSSSRYDDRSSSRYDDRTSSRYDTYDSQQTITRNPSTRGGSSTRDLEWTLASTTLDDSSTRGYTRSSSTRGGSSTRDLEKRISRLEGDKARALEQKVRDLEQRLDDMYVDNYIKDAKRKIDQAEQRAIDKEAERRAKSDADFREEIKRLGAYAKGFGAEDFYQQLLDSVPTLAKYR